jgi:carbamoyl-phosphate synthase small subunit
MQAILALEDGRVFRGKGYGAKGECYGEVVFNTSITGYQEIFTDPSYSGQIVVLTNPQIGNYGTNQEDNEATRPWIEGLIVREFSKVSSNWRSQQVAEEYLEQFKVPVLSDIDTRALVRHLARPRRDARRGLDHRERRGEAGGQGELDSEDGRHRPGKGGEHQAPLRLGGWRALA